ncbi:isopropylmalate isomerase, partial [Prochlorococcus sp. AH-736-B04]|nr:isopropylmalate isomerase [Prochlorococcus sp. AH-736-B04]
LKCVNFDSLGESVFKDDRETLKGKHPFDLEENKNAKILIVNSNFGCGSSREHAPQALMRWGIKAIIGESFADIFYSNCIAIGIPCLTLPKKSIQEIQKNKDNKFLFLEIDLKNSLAKSKDLSLKLAIKESSRKMFLLGEWDATATLLNNESLIENKYNDLPYLEFNSNLFSYSNPNN